MAELDDKVIVTKQKIIDIADQIRAELSESDEYKLDVMPTKIHEVAQGGGGSAVINPLNITQNGTYTATGNVDGYSPITVAVPSIEDGIQWVRDFDFTQSEDDRITGLSADITNCTYTQGTGLEWMNYSSKVEAFFTFNQDYNYDIIFKFDGSDFGSTGSVATLTSGTNLNLVITSDGENVELGYSVGSGAITSTGIDIESLANEEIKLQLRLNNSNNWDVTLVITGMNYSQNIGTLNGKNRYYFTFGRGQQDSFNNWILKYIQIKQIIGDGSQRTLESLNATTNGTYYPSSGHYGFDRVEVDVPSSSNLQTLNVTQNGTYVPTAPVDGWDEVNVNVDLPNEVLISHYDFTDSTNWKYDLIRGFKGQESSNITYANVLQDNNGLTIGNHNTVTNNSYFKTWCSLNWGQPKRIEIKFGDITKDATLTSGYKWLMSMDYRQAQQERGIGVNCSDDTIITYTSSGRTFSNIPLSHLSNNTLVIMFGCYYNSNDGKFYKDNENYYRTITCYIKETNEIINSNYNSPNYDSIDSLGLGTSNNVFREFVVEDVKVYDVNNLETPVSLMSASPSESKSSSESNKKETIEENADEVQEQKKESVEKASELDA